MKVSRVPDREKVPEGGGGRGVLFSRVNKRDCCCKVCELLYPCTDSLLFIPQFVLLFLFVIV